MNKFIICLIVPAVAACAATKPVESKKTATATECQKVLALQPGTTTAGELLARFGKPDMKADLKKQKNREVWLYIDKEKKVTKHSFTIDKAGKKLTAVTWFIKPGDPEEELEVSLSLFPAASFKQETPAWKNPHAAPEEEHYVDAAIGARIVFFTKHKKVASIEKSVR